MRESEKKNISAYFICVWRRHSDKNKDRKEELSNPCLLFCTPANPILRASLLYKGVFVEITLSFWVGFLFFWHWYWMFMHLQVGVGRQTNSTSGKECSPSKTFLTSALSAHQSDVSPGLKAHQNHCSAFYCFPLPEILKCFTRNSSSLMMLTFCIDFLSATELKRFTQVIQCVKKQSQERNF